jgi:phospholipase C
MQLRNLAVIRRLPLQLSVLFVLGACAQPTMSPPVGGPTTALRPSGFSSKIQHVVIIVQENRSVDDLFNGLPGADTVTYGVNSHGKVITLQPVSLTAPFDISHRHDAFMVEYANGKLNGFDLVESHCRDKLRCPNKGRRAYAYVPRSEVQPYFTMATQYAFADRMFETDQGPSFPAHQYLLSGTSTIAQNSLLRAAENPQTPKGAWTGGCDSPQGSLVQLIDQQGRETQSVYPCFDRPALTDLLEAKSLTWHYYQERKEGGLWNGPDAIKHIWQSPNYRQNVSWPPSEVMQDIGSGHLANVAWVTPTLAASDHAGNTNGTGPSWVSSIVNAIGHSQYWNSTAIFVIWDDWGGWFDHVAPKQYNSYELGFRVPLLIVSPYAKPGFVSHRQHEFGSILKFVEIAFNLGSLGTTDVRSDDLSDCFNFKQVPRRFNTIAAPHGADYFLHQARSEGVVDDDY